MPKVSVFNVAGEVVGEMELDDHVFNVTVNPALLHEAVRMFLANQRVGTAVTRTRSEVRGGGRKPWRQKGTGRARQGSIRAPHWKGGGVTFGPQMRDYSFAMPRKARRAALRGALSGKLKDGGFRVVDGLAVAAPRTKEIASMLDHLEAGGGKALIVTAAHDNNVHRSARNIPGVSVSAATDLNVYDVLNHTNLVITMEAVERVQEVLGR